MSLIARDVSDKRRAELALREANRVLARQAATDGLTGLANRRAFDEALGSVLRASQSSKATLSLLMMDVDFFKRFNDVFGHLAGDDCLRDLAGDSRLPRLRTRTRRTLRRRGIRRYSARQLAREGLPSSRANSAGGAGCSHPALRLADRSHRQYQHRLCNVFRDTTHLAHFRGPLRGLALYRAKTRAGTASRGWISTAPAPAKAR